MGRTVAGGSLAGVLSDAGEMGRARVGRPREKRSSRWREGKEVRGLSCWASASEEGSWARVGFSWARQVGPSAGFGLGFQGRLGWAWVEFWAGLSSNSFSFLFLFLTTQTI